MFLSFLTPIIERFGKLAGRMVLIGIATAGLIIFGNALDYALNKFDVWKGLVTLFAIIRKLLDFIDFIWDTTTMINLVTASLLIAVTVWGWRAISVAINFFNER